VPKQMEVIIREEELGYRVTVREHYMDETMEPEETANSFFSRLPKALAWVHFVLET